MMLTVLNLSAAGVCLSMYSNFLPTFMSTSFTAMKGAVNIRMPDRYCLVSMATRCVHVRCRCAATLGRVSSLHISITL
jgi:hypothetical protein